MDLLVGANQVAGIDLIPPAAAFIRRHETEDFPGFCVTIPLFIGMELIGLHYRYLLHPAA